MSSLGRMPAIVRPAGPLPPRVYWVRRIAVLALALGLVLGLGRLLTAGSDGSGDPQANPAAATPTGPATAGSPASAAVTSPSSTPIGPVKPAKTRKTKTPLPEPDGPCAPEDVLVAPAVERKHASDEIRMKLKVSTRTTPACLFALNARSVTLKITSGKDLIWESQDCPRSVPSRTLVLRQTKPVPVEFTWSGRRSDDQCSRSTRYALPGWYHLYASALSGEPEDAQFELLTPKPIVVTEKPQTDKGKQDKGQDKRGKKKPQRAGR